MTHFSCMMSKENFVSCLFLMALISLMAPTSLFAQDVIAPPSLGQQTQGESANLTEPTINSAEADQSTEDNSKQDSSGFLGTTNIIERRGENGQINSIELEHSNGSKQYIDRDYSAGEIDAKPNNIEEEPNLAKWRLGSW